jgi:hypothetical protein
LGFLPELQGQEIFMSSRNGDKARYGRLRKRKLEKRLQSRALKGQRETTPAEGETKTETSAEPDAAAPDSDTPSTNA